MEYIDTVWLSLEKHYKRIAEKVAAQNSSYICDIGKYNNENFLLRGYLSILKHKDGDELSITVDIKKIEGAFIIETDISTNDGVILFEGPAYNRSEFSVCSINEWLSQYELHLKQNEMAILERIRALE